MDGKTVIVTGATSGVGMEAARALGARGASVAVVGRNAEKGARVLADLRGSARHPDRLDFFRADFADLAAVRALAEVIRGRFAQVDVLINNAGVINQKRRVTPQGFEETFAVNHLAHFMLTGHLLDLLKLGRARIINVSSNAHLAGKLDLADLQTAHGYRTFKAYARSKLANLYFTFELARRLAGSGVTANAMHPGAVASGFAMNNGGLAKFAMTVFKPFFISPEKAAETAVFLATSPEVEGLTGGYYYKSRIIAPSKRSQDAATARALWEASAEMTGYPYRELLPEGILQPVAAGS